MSGLGGRLVRPFRLAIDDLVVPALVEVAPGDHREPAAAVRRRRTVVAITLVVGAVLLGLSLTVRAGSSTFYPLTAGLAATWIAGGFASGPLHLGRIDFRGSLRRPVVTPILIGVLAGAIFIAGALVVREIEPLRDLVQNVLDHARKGSLALVAVITVANGVAEEVFFRGALFPALGSRRRVVVSTTIYTIVTLATGNLMLTFAAATVGTVFALQRRASGGILAPSISHVVWSMIMLFALPPLFH
ncbi:MAG: CPBP family intramembrane metalloprotease [Actinomycetota bacterium]|nr:CPBP family intramembrane metalloprotease [Actinomycetota bacterium]